MKKIGFFWFGQYRSMETVFPRNIKNIEKYNHNIFHFYSVWNERGQSETEFDNLGFNKQSKDKITHFDFEKLGTFKYGYIHDKEERYNEIMSFSNEILNTRFLAYNAMILHFKSFLNYIKGCNLDLIILLRCDVEYKFNLDSILNHNLDDKIYVGKDGNSQTINDTLFIGNHNTMLKFIDSLEYDTKSAHSDWLPFNEWGNLDEVENINMYQEIIYLNT